MDHNFHNDFWNSFQKKTCARNAQIPVPIPIVWKVWIKISERFMQGFLVADRGNQNSIVNRKRLQVGIKGEWLRLRAIVKTHLAICKTLWALDKKKSSVH